MAVIVVVAHRGRRRENERAAALEETSREKSRTRAGLISSSRSMGVSEDDTGNALSGNENACLYKKR